jgi:hypothetical protein
MAERKPHTCPTCGGRKPAKERCDTCERTGVVWSPEADPTEGNIVERDEALDLTYRR